MISDTIKQRYEIHGAWADNARITNEIKHVYQSEPGWDRLNVEQQEALNLIAVKLSRILSGDPNHADHWHDIAGYATLAERSCPEQIESVIRDSVAVIKSQISSIPPRVGPDLTNVVPTGPLNNL
jgi:Domain of unknown function (DUF6378)